MVTIEINPLTIALVGTVGAVVGGLTTAGTYVLYRGAREVGEELAPEEARIRLSFPSGSSQGGETARRFILPAPDPLGILEKLTENGPVQLKDPLRRR